MHAKTKVKKTIKYDKDMAELFNQLIGQESREISITYSKYMNMKEHCAQLIRIFSILCKSSLVAVYVSSEARVEMTTFCNETTCAIENLFQTQLPDAVFMNNESVGASVVNEFHIKYDKAKTSNVVKMFITMCDNLAPYKDNFCNIGAMNHHFIQHMSGVSWAPLPIKKFDIKDLFCQCANKPNVISFIMTVLNKLFIHSIALYEIVTSPDVDISRFSESIVSYIGTLRKVPELSRCGKAFDKIKDSLQLLKDRFSDYYNDSLRTSNNFIIMEHFILDVSNNTQACPETTRQFHTIIQYYREKASQNGGDSKFTSVFNKLDSTIKSVDRPANIDNMKKTKTKVVITPTITAVVARSTTDLAQSETAQNVAPEIKFEPVDHVDDGVPSKHISEEDKVDSSDKVIGHKS